MKIKQLLISSMAIFFASNAYCAPVLQMSPGTDGGILSTQITRTRLTAKERQSIKAIQATADVYAGANNIRIHRNESGMVISDHSVCFTTWLTTEADYKFSLDVGGHQVVMSDHIVIPNDRRTCVQHQLYQNVRFPVPGVYSSYALTTATTRMAGERRAQYHGTISVS